MDERSIYADGWHPHADSTGIFSRAQTLHAELQTRTRKKMQQPKYQPRIRNLEPQTQHLHLKACARKVPQPEMQSLQENTKVVAKVL